MSNLRKWGELYEVYKEVNRVNVLKSLYRHKPLLQSWPYWVALILYLLTPVAAYFFGKESTLSMLSIVAAALAIYTWLEFKIAEAYHERYLYHKLKAQPFFLRTKYLSYILFVEKLSELTSITKNDVNNLVGWENVRDEKIDSLAFFRTPGILLLFTVLSSIFIEYLKIKEMINTEYFFLGSLLVFIVLWSSWIISDTLKSHKKKNLEICRFLKWWKLEGP